MNMNDDDDDDVEREDVRDYGEDMMRMYVGGSLPPPRRARAFVFCCVYCVVERRRVTCH